MTKTTPSPQIKAKLLCYEAQEGPEPWGRALAKIAPDISFHGYPNWPETDDGLPTFALVWNPPHGLLAKYPHMKAIFSLGAGVDHLTRDTSLPDIPVVRMSDTGLKDDMADYVLMGTLMLHRHMALYMAQKSERLFARRHAPRGAAVTVGVMGYGALGRAAADTLLQNGYRVRAWSRSPKVQDPAGPALFAGADALPDFLSEVDILVSLLPETAETKNLIDTDFLGLCKPGIKILNAGRGGIIDDTALLAALDSGHVTAAMLDVFKTEPLPDDHPYWTHPGVIITPHTAAITRPMSAVSYVVEGIEKSLRGEPLDAVLDIQLGY